MENSQALPPGTRLEEFLIERVLGAGGFGITYLARDTALGRQVVIKENLPAQFCFRDTHSLTVAPRHTTGEDAENFAWSMENFSKEAAMLASLDHSGIVKVLRSFHAFGTAYFVMPYVDGIALDELVKQRSGKPFAEDELRGLLERVLGALSYLHDRGIYHRDIKPGNILITHEGIPVLIDFGSARQRLSERSMTVVESAGYTPFEQLQSRGNVGPWSDLYALGATVVKSITSESLPKANDRAFDDPWVPLADRPDIATRLSSPFLSGIDKSVQPRAQDRWQDGREWIAALNGEGHERQEASAPRPPERERHAVEPPSKPADPPVSRGPASAGGRRKPVRVIAIAAVLVLGAVVLAGLLKSGDGETVASGESELSGVPGVVAAPEPSPIPQVETLREKPSSPSLANGKVGDGLKFPIGAGEEILIKYVPGGRFQMGSPRGEADRRDNEDQVWVTLSSHFWMGETEVTQGQWVAVMGINPSHFKDGDWKKLPVELVSWNDAQEFIKRLNAQTPLGAGWKWALPTEAQWERACRGGRQTATAFGDSLSSRQANFDGNYPYGGAAKGPYLQKTAPVKSYEPNDYGLYDMHGNVWEWCADAYQEALPGGADPLVSTGSDRVLRGGSWYSSGRLCRSSYRGRITPDYRYQNLGFRLAAVPAGRSAAAGG